MTMTELSAKLNPGTDSEIFGSVEGMLPGWELASALAATDLAEVDSFELVEVLKAGRRMASWAASVEAAAIAEMHRRRCAEEAPRRSSVPGEHVVDEVGAALTLTGMTAGALVDTAFRLTDGLPGTYEALSEGRIDAAKARVICEGTRLTSDEVRARVEAKVLPLAPVRTTSWLRRKVREAVIIADPAAYAEQRQEAKARQRVELWENQAETSDLAGRDLPSEQASRAFNRINSIAAAVKSDGDPRPIDFLRGEVLMALLLGADPCLGAGLTDVPQDPDDPTAAGDDTRIEVQAQARARSEAQAVADIRPGPEAGTAADRVLAGSIAERMREVLTDATCGAATVAGRVWLIAEAGHRIRESLTGLKAPGCTTTVKDGRVVHGHDRYRPSAGMRREIEARDGTCVFPGCRQPTRRCDCDHTIAFHLGGATCPCNLALLCRHHHRTKQADGWRLIQVWPGVLLWITPSAHWYVTGPEP
jgi:Domain of unknown function (DUF222)